jgi:hypothetical protein
VEVDVRGLRTVGVLLVLLLLLLVIFVVVVRLSLCGCACAFGCALLYLAMYVCMSLSFVMAKAERHKEYIKVHKKHTCSPMSLQQGSQQAR